MPQRVANAEFARLCNLYRHGVLDTEADPAIEAALAALAVRLDVPVARLVFADAQRFWAMGGVGPVEPTLLRGQGPFEDLLSQGAPFLAVVDHAEATPPLRSFAGVRLLSAEEEALGVLYVADTRPRDLGAAEALAGTAATVRVLLDSRRRLQDDESTGALKREAFLDGVERLIAVSRMGRQWTSLVTFDLAGFHSALGMRVPGLASLALRLMADLGRTQVRSRDCFGRLGPDLFAVLLTDTGEAGAQILARRLSRHLERGWSAAGLRLTGPTVGIACTGAASHGDTAETLLARATATPWDPAEVRMAPRVA